MADIRCSNCQTLNPADATLCKQCGRPLMDESVNWLNSLRGESEPSPWEEPETTAKANDEAQPNEEIPDWLQRIRQRNQEEQSQPLPFKSGDESPDEEIPAWLSPSTGESAASGTSDEEDWLRNLRGSDVPPETEPTTSPAPFEEDQGEESQTSAPDWMKNLETWQTDQGSQPENEAVEPAIDWTSRFGSTESQTEAPAASVEDNPDWLENLTPQGDRTPSTGESDMDWLAGLQSAAEPITGEEPAVPAGEEIDWLSRLGGEIKPEESIQPEGFAPFSSEGETVASEQAFSWQDEPGANETEPGETEKTPDWLRQFATDEPEAFEEPSLESTAQNEPESFETRDEQLPDWLSSFSAQESEQPTAEAKPWSEPEEETAPVAGESIPDWLQGYSAEPSQPQVEPVAPISEEPVEESFSWQSIGIPADSTIPAEEPSEVSPFAASNLPDWLDQTSSVPPRSQFDQEMIPPAEPASELTGPKAFAQSGLPEWLDESGEAIPAVNAASEDLPAEADAQSLEAAELPSWLQSMRPIEMVAPKPAATEEKRTEKAGPLAGLAGVLPSEDLVGQYIKPPLYSVKLRVSEKQRVHASLIENLISEENQPQPIPAERSEAPQRVLRFLLAAILIIAILLPMLNIIPAIPAADILPQELVAFETIMTDESILAPGAAVLLALEYEPGLAGEMQTASEAVIRQLAEKNVRLTVISSSPTGPILAEELLQKAEFDPAFVVNLGYLAAGSTGLQSFSISPIQAAPATLQGQLASWNSGVLEGVSKLDDFAAVLVLTDDPDKGRNWVEQVQPALHGKPLLMISSAQAAPLLLPYYNSKQIQGIISGITGAAGYENLIQSSGTASLLRGSYQYAMLLTALLILIGSLITGIITSITRGKAEKEV